MMKAEKEDELLGNWHAEEESLGFSAVLCYGVTFNTDNTGIYYFHAVFNNEEIPFIWQRLNETEIKIFVEENIVTDEDDIEDDRATTEGDIEADRARTTNEYSIEYVITDYIGVLYDIPYKKLTFNKMSGLWWYLHKDYLVKSIKQPFKEEVSDEDFVTIQPTATRFQLFKTKIKDAFLSFVSYFRHR